MEIERKFLIERLPKRLAQYPYRLIEQAYLTTAPVIRVRRESEPVFPAVADDSREKETDVLKPAFPAAADESREKETKAAVSYWLTYKGKGALAHEEYNLPLTAEAYETLKSKADGNVISKTRYLLPVVPSASDPFRPANDPQTPFSSRIVELDVFAPPFAPLVLAEVEFESVEEARSFVPLDWFGQDVTEDPAYHNASMSRRIF